MSKSEWKEMKLGDCLELVNGRAYKQIELLSSGTPVLRIQNLNGGNNWYFSDLDLPEKNYCNKGDLLFAWSATFGPYQWDGPKSIFHYHIWNVKPDEQIDIGFAYYLLLNISASVKAAAHGITMVHITKEKMLDWPISLPPLPEQKRIAAILDKADNLRRKNQQAIHLADKFLRSVFLDMFGDPVTNPKGWEIGKITALADVITGYAFKSSEFVQESDDAVRLCRGANTLTGYFDWSDTVYWPKQKISGLDQYSIKQGDIILAMDRPWISSGLKVVIADNFDKETYLVQRVARLRPIKPIFSDFIFSCIKSKSFESHCCPTETTVPHISPIELKNFEVMLPDEVELKKFHEVAQRVRSLNRSLGVCNCKAEMSFNALSQTAFFGHV